MKHVLTILLLLAMLHLPVAGHLRAGEIQKQPLQLEEMVELTREQMQDFAETRETEAGIANGYGILTLALAIAVGVLIYNEVND